MKVAGLDLSMTATGVAYSPAGVYVAATALIKPRVVKDMRLVEIKSEVHKLVDGSELVLVEDLPTHAKAAGITGMVHGAVRVELIEMGIRYGTVPPATLKKYATGAGNADKIKMAVAALKRGGVEFSNDNECDAWWLWVMANDLAGHPVFALPQAQRGSLAKIDMERV